MERGSQVSFGNSFSRKIRSAWDGTLSAEVKSRKKTDGFAGLLYLVGPSDKDPIAASQLLVAEVVDRQLKQQLEQEIFKIDSYTNLVLQYLRLESFHDDLVLKQVQIEDLVKEIIRKYALFFIQKA